MSLYFWLHFVFHFFVEKAVVTSALNSECFSLLTFAICFYLSDGSLAKDIIDKFFREEFEILMGIEPHQVCFLLPNT